MLIIRNPGIRNTLYNANSNCFTRANTAAAAGRTLGRISASAPAGVLGGFGAMMSGNYEVNISITNDKCIGLFLNDASSSAHENTPAVASGKITVMTGAGSYETDIYETVKEAGGALDVAWTASLGLPLYVSDFGLLTTEAVNTKIVGYITSAPTATNPFVGFNTVNM